MLLTFQGFDLVSITNGPALSGAECRHFDAQFLFVPCSLCFHRCIPPTYTLQAPRRNDQFDIRYRH